MSHEFKLTLFGAIVGALASSIIAFGFQYLGDDIDRKKTARLDMAVEYNQAESQLTPLAARYISVITGGGDLQAVQSEIRGKVAEEIERAEKLKPVFKNADPAIVKYQDALQTFATSLDGSTDPTKMRNWAESLGHVVDTRDALGRVILRDAGA